MINPELSGGAAGAAAASAAVVAAVGASAAAAGAAVGAAAARIFSISGSGVAAMLVVIFGFFLFGLGSSIFTPFLWASGSVPLDGSSVTSRSSGIAANGFDRRFLLRPDG